MDSDLQVSVDAAVGGKGSHGRADGHRDFRDCGDALGIVVDVREIGRSTILPHRCSCCRQTHVAGGHRRKKVFHKLLDGPTRES